MHFKVINNLLIRTCFIIFLTAASTQALADKKLIKEYGVVILPSNDCIQKASALNKEIANKLPGLANLTNEWHVSIFHGAYSDTYYKELRAIVMTMELKPIELHFDKVYSTSDRWIDFGVKKNAVLNKLHKKIVKAASRLTQRSLQRAHDIYHELSQDKKKQVDEYGVHGVLEHYKPHMTLFYQYPSHPELHKVAKEIAKTVKPMRCKAEKIAIAELEYNGNISKIVQTIDLP